MTCSWLTIGLFNTCLQFVHHLVISKIVHHLFATFSFLVYVMFMTCAWIANGLLMVSPWLSSLELFTTWSFLVLCFFFTSSLFVHNLFITCSSLIHTCLRTYSGLYNDLSMTCSWHFTCYEWFTIFMTYLCLVLILFKIFHDLLTIVGS